MLVVLKMRMSCLETKHKKMTLMRSQAKKLKRERKGKEKQEPRRKTKSLLMKVLLPI
jgi:hypothetical protein